MYGLGLSRALGARAIASHRFSNCPQLTYKAPTFRQMPVTLQPVLATRLLNLAFTWDHNLMEDMCGEMDTGDDEVILVTKNIEGTRPESN